MKVREAIYTRRTIRKFTEQTIPLDVLRELADTARIAPSAMNLQPLKYKLVGSEGAQEVFPYTRWAAAIAPAGNPKPGEEPKAYIIILNDNNIRKSGYEIDVGLAAENIVLAAMEMGISTCLLGVREPEKVAEGLKLPENLTPALFVALGYAAQKSEAYTMVGNNYKYDMAPDSSIHVPKRSLDDIIIE